MQPMIPPQTSGSNAPIPNSQAPPAQTNSPAQNRGSASLPPSQPNSNNPAGPPMQQTQPNQSQPNQPNRGPPMQQTNPAATPQTNSPQPAPPNRGASATQQNSPAVPPVPGQQNVQPPVSGTPPINQQQPYQQRAPYPHYPGKLIMVVRFNKMLIFLYIRISTARAAALSKRIYVRATESALSDTRSLSR